MTHHFFVILDEKALVQAERVALICRLFLRWSGMSDLKD
jgi:hypothetical protein